MINMEKIYLYIDDEPNSHEKVAGFENDGVLKIQSRQNEDTWEKQFKFFSDNSQFDGLMLDLKLDDYKVLNEKGEKVSAGFSGTAIAQEIRTRQKDGKMQKQIPIILFSANDNLMLEDFGKNLFDLCIEKTEVNDDNFPIFMKKMVDLSDGYQILSSEIDLSKILSTDVNLIDSRFINVFESFKDSPINVKIRFLISEFLEKQGLLINEDILAARLGVDKKESNDWDNLKKELSVAKYSGILCNGWQRWWAHLVEKWWNETVKAESRLRSTSAKDRVNVLKLFTNLSNLVAAQKIEKAESDEFWTVCKGYDKPIDTIDGLLICGQENLYPWQDYEYVSVDAALKKKNNAQWHSLADIEKEHYEELKQYYTHQNR